MKLNFGCGYDLRPDWVNVDKADYGQPAECHFDILTDPWPFDYKFELIEANHVMHMFDYKELTVVLRKLVLHLAPGGFLRIIDFDPISAVEAYQRGDSEALIMPDKVAPTLDQKLGLYMSYYSTRKTITTAKGMAELATAAGLKRARWFRGLPEGAHRAKESWQMEGHV